MVLYPIDDILTNVPLEKIKQLDLDLARLLAESEPTDQGWGNLDMNRYNKICSFFRDEGYSVLKFGVLTMKDRLQQAFVKIERDGVEYHFFSSPYDTDITA